MKCLETVAELKEKNVEIREGYLLFHALNFFDFF